MLAVSDLEQGLDNASGSAGSDNTSDAAVVEIYMEPQLLPDGMYECPLCYAQVASFPKISVCNHRACAECWKEYLRISITESRINITCYHCSKLLHPNGNHHLLPLYIYIRFWFCF